jgi:hypothetical protein
MNPSFEATCDQCGAPLRNIPADESGQATEVVLNRTPHRFPRRVTLIGVWAICLPNVLAEPWFAFLVLKHMGGLAGFIMFWGSLGFTFLWFFILYRTTRNYFFRDQRTDSNR